MLEQDLHGSVRSREWQVELLVLPVHLERRMAHESRSGSSGRFSVPTSLTCPLLHPRLRLQETDKWHAGDNSTIAFTYSNANGFIRFIENSRSNVTVLMRFPGTQEPQWLVRKEALLVLDDTGAVIFNTSDVLPATVNRLVA